MTYVDDLTLPAKVFVYGTLKQAYGNHRLLVGAAFLGSFNTAKAEFNMTTGGVPFVARQESNGHFIEGELYEVTDQAMMDSLDRLEGHPTFYCREKVEIENGEEAYMYIVDEPYGEKVNVSATNSQSWGGRFQY